jgi:hypothetical protein
MQVIAYTGRGLPGAFYGSLVARMLSRHNVGESPVEGRGNLAGASRVKICLPSGDLTHWIKGLSKEAQWSRGGCPNPDTYGRFRL